jgi:preprotein translocase subunit SecB
MSTNGGQQGEQPQGPTPAVGAVPGVGPQLNVLAQYTKDLSFENPNAPKSLGQPGQQPAINIQINVNPNQLSNTDFEIELKLEGKAEVNGTVLFNFELVYAGVFRLQNIPQEQIGPVVMIECPRLLFPFARAIVADAVVQGGFPPLMLDPVDFVGLYRQKVGQQPQAAPASSA